MKISFGFQVIFALVVLANICVWFYARPLQTEWRNVPPAPSDFAAHATGLGDYNLAYRMTGFMLQNIGQVDGRTQNLQSYDYAELEKWFYVAYDLLPRSNYIPLLATYYYGATQNKEDVKRVINFLKVAGKEPIAGRWRWVVHAIFLARHRADDMELAFEMAQILKDIKDPSKPGWTEMMPAMIRNAKGEKEDAYLMMRAMLESSADTLHPAEVRHIVGYICEQILTKDEASKDPICDFDKP